MRGLRGAGEMFLAMRWGTVLSACVLALCFTTACGPRGSGHGPDGSGEDGGSRDGLPDEDVPDRIPEREPWHPPEGSTFGARVSPPTVDQPTRSVGEACSTYGASDCRGGTCLKVAPLPNPLQVCTRTCDAESPCPDGWSCRAIRPGAPALCTPSLEIARRLRNQSTGGGR